MDFVWSQEQQNLYQKVLLFTQEQLLDRNSRDAAEWWTREQWQQCGEAGVLGLCVPRQFGGGDFNALTTAYAIEAFGHGCRDMGLVFSAAAHLFACIMPITKYGSEYQQAKWLPGLCLGELIGANAITEPEAGSDVFALKTRAAYTGDGYVLTGVKNYVTNGPVADVFVVYASTNLAHGHLGISAFVIEKNTPGLVYSEPIRKMGLTSTPACQIHLQDCYVPASHRLGREGEGAAIFNYSMRWERACLFAAYLGQMERQLEQTIKHARERRQFRKPIGKNQAIAHRVVDMKFRLEAARLLLYRACWAFDQGQDPLLFIALSKIAVSESAVQNGLDAIHIHGSIGIDSNVGIEQMLRDAIPATIFSGTAEMQRNIIASELGL